MTPEMKKDYTRRISQANKSEIIVIVYDLVDYYIDEAIQHKNNNEEESYIESCHNAENGIKHLINSLDDAYNLAYPLMNLYCYFNKEISMAAALEDISRLIKVQAQIKSLAESFAEVAKADASAPLMENSQTVYAGLTYKKGDLNENLYDEGSRRGYTV